MKAVVMYGPNNIRYEDVEKPTCPEGGFLLKIKAVGLCGSDIRNLLTDSRKGKYPHIYGHEQVGIIEEIDKNVTGFKVGDRVYVYAGDPCMECEFCLKGQTQNCMNPGDYLERQGGFADYIGVLKTQLRGSVHRIPEGVDMELATLAEPLSSVYSCLENVNISIGDTVVILGAGPIGCFHAQLAKLRGAFKIIMTDINDTRLDLARQFGVDYAINSKKEDAVDAVKKLTCGRGADKVISANPTVEGQAQCIYMLKKGGTGVFFGGVQKGKTAEIDTNYIHYNNIWLFGQYGASLDQVKKAFDLAISPLFPTRKFITHIMPLSQIKEAIKLTQTGEAIKVVLIP
jgi:L-iditol 2-dehydrogenase